MVNGRRPSTHCWADTPCGWSTQAAAHRAATDSAGSGAADGGRLLGVSGGDRRQDRRGDGASPGVRPVRVCGVGVAPPDATAVPTPRTVTAPIPATAPTTTASSSTTVSPSRAGERNGHCHSAR